MSEGNGLSVYHPRQSQQSPLWKLLEKHYATFEQGFEQKYQKTYGYRRAVVDDVVRGYLKCGDLREGFARVRCPDCCHEDLLSFSCKGCWSCPSCHAKKVIQFGELLQCNILSPIAHRWRSTSFAVRLLWRKSSTLKIQARWSPARSWVMERTRETLKSSARKNSSPGSPSTSPRNPFNWCATMAGIRTAQEGIEKRSNRKHTLLSHLTQQTFLKSPNHHR